MDIQNQLAAVEAANVTLNTENAQLRQALRAIRKGLSEDSDGEFWPARRWLDARKIYHGDLSGNRVLELVAKHALHGKLDDEPLAAFTPAEPQTPEPHRYIGGLGQRCQVCGEGPHTEVFSPAPVSSDARPARTLKDYARHDAGCDYFKCVDCGDWWDDGMCICQPPKSSTCSCGLDALLSGGAR